MLWQSSSPLGVCRMLPAAHNMVRPWLEVRHLGVARWAAVRLGGVYLVRAASYVSSRLG